MRDDDVREVCRKLKPILGTKADGLWLAYATAETPHDKLEIEGVIQALAAQHLLPTVDSTRILLPPPQYHESLGEFPLGSVQYAGSALFPVHLTRHNLVKHTSIFGITGSGKTVVAQLLALGLLSKDIPFLVVDWKRSYRDLRTLDNPRVANIQVYSVGRKSALPFNWNPLRAPPGVHDQTWISVVAEVLEKSHISGQGSADIFIEVLDREFERAGFYAGTADAYPNFFDARQTLDKLKFTGRRMLWQDTCLRILRTFTFGPAAGAFNARHPIKIEELLERPVIIELDQELPKPLRVFFSDLILRWIHLYRLGQGESETLRHVTFLEEVHNLFPRTQHEKQASNSLETVFREVRGFGEGLVNVTQHPSLLPIYVLGNTGTLICLSLQHEEDIMTAKRALFLNDGDEVFLDRLNVGEGIVKIKGRFNSCHVKFPYVPVIKGGDNAATDLGEIGDQ